MKSVMIYSLLKIITRSPNHLSTLYCVNDTVCYSGQMCFFQCDSFTLKIGARSHKYFQLLFGLVSERPSATSEARNQKPSISSKALHH